MFILLLAVTLSGRPFNFRWLICNASPGGESLHTDERLREFHQ